jgi:uncharacterized membrane protein YdjX (TVP38/TMEM64 family)
MVTAAANAIRVGRFHTGDNCPYIPRLLIGQAGDTVQKLKDHRGRYLIKGAVALVGLLIIGLAWQPLADLLALLGDREAVIAYVQDSGPWGPVFLALFQFLQVIVAVIPAQPFMVAAGWSYGFTGGLVINLGSMVAASQLAFALARWVGHPAVDRLVPGSAVERWMKVVERQGAMFFLIVYLVPIFPTDTMNFVAGLSSISPRRFLVANSVGRLPWAILMTLVGSHGLELTPQVWAVIAGIVICAAGLFVAGWYFTARSEGHRCAQLSELIQCLA